MTHGTRIFKNIHLLIRIALSLSREINDIPKRHNNGSSRLRMLKNRATRFKKKEKGMLGLNYVAYSR
jgi:hypothetical protein